MIELIIGFILGTTVTYGAPLLKKLIIKIVTKGFNKASKEVDRWH